MTGNLEAIKSCVKRASDSAAKRQERLQSFLDFFNASLAELDVDMRKIFLRKGMMERVLLMKNAKHFSLAIY